MVCLRGVTVDFLSFFFSLLKKEKNVKQFLDVSVLLLAMVANRIIVIFEICRKKINSNKKKAKLKIVTKNVQG